MLSSRAFGPAELSEEEARTQPTPVDIREKIVALREAAARLN